eukprot:jgi/Hompol1/2584/HPOL_001428-RA
MSTPGKMNETGDKKKDAARREAIEKMSVHGQKPKWVKEVIQSQDKETRLQALLNSDTIVYDLLNALDEASWAIEALAERADQFDKPKVFIAISSIMTWARTKVESEDGDGVIAEDEYRRRKPHPNWKAHLSLEKNITKLGKKNNLKAYVIASGLIYHAGDSIFHSLFKAAWMNEPELPCFGDGSNNLPTIHLDDLISIIAETIETTPENKYLVAVDESKNTLYDITKAISESLGTGMVKKLPKEQAFLQKTISQADYDMLTTNLKLDPGHIKEMSIEWKYESGLVENLPQMIQEYKDARGLWPLKIVIHGPPASGKSFYAQKIAEHYKIHIVDADQVVQDALARLERRVSGETNNDEQDAEDIEVDREVLNELKEAIKNNNGKYPSAQVISFVRDRLRSMPCRNQGYILDGFPTTLDEAKQLFKGTATTSFTTHRYLPDSDLLHELHSSASDDDIKDDKIPPADELITPEFVFSLEVTDQAIKQRIMKLPEAAVTGTKNSEEALTKRLEEFRKANTDENTVLNYFDELEIHPIILSAESTETHEIMETVIKAIGQPRNYGPSAEEIAEERRRTEAIHAKADALAAEERAKREHEELERHAKAVAEWNNRLEEVRRQEQEVLEAQSVPLRNYLMKHVMPTLTAGLIEVAKTRPEDPIDYLAEFLFK